MNEIDETKKMEFARKFLKAHKIPLLWGEWSSYQVRSSYRGFFPFRKYDAVFYSPQGNVFMVYFGENRFKTLDVYVNRNGEVEKISPIEFFFGVSRENKKLEKIDFARKYFEKHESPLLWGKWTSYHTLHISYDGFFVLNKYDTLFYTPKGNNMILYYGDNRFWIQDVYISKGGKVEKITPMEFFLRNEEEVKEE